MPVVPMSIVHTLRGLVRHAKDTWEARSDAWADLTPDAQELYEARNISSAGRRQIVSKSGLAHRLVWAIPEDALAEGWAIDTDNEQDITRDLDRRMRIEEQLIKAAGSARLDGGAWLWLVTEGDDWREPLPQGAKIVQVHALSQPEVIVNIAQMETDPASREFGRPKFCNLQINRHGMSAQYGQVHTSRLIWVPGGLCTPDFRSPDAGYDQSVLQLYMQAIGDLDGVGHSVGRLLSRLSIPWVKLANGRTVAAGDLAASLIESIGLLNDSMRSSGLMILTGDDEAGWSGPSLAGVRDGVLTLNERLACVEGIPLSRLFGQAPGGLSTDDASGRRSYDALIARFRRTRLQPVLLNLYDRLLGPDPSRTIRWPALSPPTPMEASQISSAYAARDAALVTAQIITPEEARTRFEGNEEAPLPQLDMTPIDPFDENLAAPSVLPPSVPPVPEGAASSEIGDEPAV